MADKRRNRGTAKHAGVVVLSKALPSGNVRWFVRYVDPDDCPIVGGRPKRKEATIPDSHAGTEETRRAWAEWKAGEVTKRGKLLEEGAPAKTGRELTDVVAEYYRLNAPRFDEAGNVTAEGRIRLATYLAYRKGTDSLLAFAEERRIALADELREQHLEAFRAWLFARPRQAQAKGGKRGARVASRAKLSVVGVNSRMRAVKTVLDALRRLGLVPMLTHDHIRDSLRAEREPRPLPDYLRSAQVRALLRATLRHDTERFALTREEKAAGLEGGTTPKHEPIAPFVAFVLFTGMRFDEARLVRWDAVDLDAPPGGTIHVGTEAKTGQARLVDLTVSPVLVRLLRAMKLRAGDAPYLFGGLEPWSRSAIEKARKRLVDTHGAPAFDWQSLRATCGTFLANAAGIFGGASAYREARQLGHSIQVAEKHYLGVVHVDREATTLEAALGVDGEARAVVRHASGEKVPQSAMSATA